MLRAPYVRPMTARPRFASTLVPALALVSLAACSGSTTRTAKADITISPVSLDFGTKPPTSKTKLTLTIQNTGEATLNLSSATIKNDPHGSFSVGQLPPTLAGGG